MLGAIYGGNIGLDVQETTFMITAYMGGTLITQWPIGWLSDRFDRRKVLAGVNRNVVFFSCGGLKPRPSRAGLSTWLS